MFLTRKHLSRRTVLKGAGASIALPLLDAMIPAGTALAQTAAAPSRAAGLRVLPARRVAGPMAAEARPAGVSSFRTSCSRSRRCASTSPWSAACATRAARARGPHGIIEETWLNCVESALAKCGDGRRRHGRSDRGATPHEGYDAAVHGALRRAGRHDLVPNAGPAAAYGG